ncbi:hypothetical protein ACWFZ6_18695 [Methylorubrum extorquens]
MSIKVKRNVDGTLTVTCGKESIIVGGTNPPTQPGTNAPTAYPPIAPGGGGVTASLVAKSSSYVTVQISANSAGEIQIKVKNAIDSLRFAPEVASDYNVIIRVVWDSDDELHVAEVLRSLASNQQLQSNIKIAYEFRFNRLD